MQIPATLQPLRLAEAELLQGTLPDGPLPAKLPPRRRIRATFLRHVLLSRELTPQLRGQHIEGHLDLSGLSIEFPLVLSQCRLDTLSLVDARTQTIDLSGSTCSGIEATRVRVDGAVLLGDGFRSDGCVRLNDAVINGPARLDGGSFVEVRDKRSALLFEGAQIGGRLFLRKVRCRGRVSGMNARVAGGIVGEEARFVRVGGNALMLAGLRAGGRVNLRDMRVDGPTSFNNARIEGDLDLEGAHLASRQVAALRLEGAHIEGALQLTRARFGGRRAVDAEPPPGDDVCAELDEGEPLAQNAASYAMDALEVRIDRGVEGNDLVAVGQLRLRGANVAGTVTLKGAELKSGLSLPGARLGGELILKRTRFSPEAELVLAGASIGGRLVWLPETPAELVDARSARVGILEDQPRLWPTEGSRLGGFAYSALHERGRIEDREAWLLTQRDGYVSQPYEHLAGVLKAVGDEEGTRRIGIAKEKHRTATAKWWVKGLRHTFLNLPVRYGYEPWRALVAAVIVIAIGYAVFSEGPFVAAKRTDPPPQVNRLVYSIDTFLPIIELPQKAPGIPSGGDRTYLWVHIALGWLLTTIGVIAVTGVVRRN